MNIAFIGQKGIPAKWGGVESHVEELSTRLVKKNHNVTVYVRSWYTKKTISEFNGVIIKHVNSINTKSLDALTHSFNCSINSLFKKFDIIHYQAMGPSLCCWIPKICFNKVIATIHRYDYEADKWNRFAKRVLKISEKFALKIPDKTIVVANFQKEYYKKIGFETTYIPNGVNIPRIIEPDVIKKDYGLNCKDYILYLGRLVPEKRCDWIINAYNSFDKKIKKDLKFVIAGGSSASDDYVQYLKSLSNDSNIIFTGYVSGVKKQELYSNALLFILPSNLEGLPIAILEAASYKLPILASDILACREVIKNKVNGLLFNNEDFNDFREKLLDILNYPESKLQELGLNAYENVVLNYNWDKIADKTEEVYKNVLKGV